MSGRLIYLNELKPTSKIFHQQVLESTYTNHELEKSRYEFMSWRHVVESKRCRNSSPLVTRENFSRTPPRVCERQTPTTTKTKGIKGWIQATTTRIWTLGRIGTSPQAKLLQELQLVLLWNWGIPPPKPTIKLCREVSSSSSSSF